MTTAPSRLNVLWICADQQRWDTIAALGHRGPSTPTLDRLVAEGTSFTHAFAQSTMCTPSRASFLTGLYPSALHMHSNGAERFTAPERLVSRILAAEGWRCGLVGKFHLSSCYGKTEERCDDGYGTWRFSHAPRDDWPTGHDYADWVRAKGFSLAQLTRDPDGVPAELHQTTWCADEAIGFIERSDEPWLLSVNIYDPHPEFNPPRRYRDMFDPATMPPPLFRPSDLKQQARLKDIYFQTEARSPERLDIASPVIPRSPGGPAPALPTSGIAVARDAGTLKAAYYAMIRQIDDQVARMLFALERRGVSDRTLVIYSSDHGEMLGDHGLVQKGCRFYEGMIRVPLIFRLPGTVPAGARRSELVELTDILPTILDLVGVTSPTSLHGRSLRLDPAVPPGPERHFVRTEFYCGLNNYLGSSTLGTMLRTPTMKLVAYHGTGLGELYDLTKDPDEFVDLWDDPGYHGRRGDLLRLSFDATVAAMDPGPRCLGPM